MGRITWWAQQCQALAFFGLWISAVVLTGLGSVLAPMISSQNDQAHLLQQHNTLLSWRFYYQADGQLDDHIHSTTLIEILNNVHENPTVAMQYEMWHWLAMVLQVGLTYLAALVGVRHQTLTPPRAISASVSEPPSRSFFKSTGYKLLEEFRNPSTSL